MPYAVDVNNVVVMFVKVKVKTKVLYGLNCVVVRVVVTVTCIGAVAGAFGTSVTMDTTTATITKAATTALAVDGLLKTTLGIISA